MKQTSLDHTARAKAKHAIELLGHKKKIFEFLLEHPKASFTGKEIATLTKIKHTSTYGPINQMIHMGLVYAYSDGRLGVIDHMERQETGYPIAATKDDLHMIARMIARSLKISCEEKAAMDTKAQEPAAHKEPGQSDELKAALLKRKEELSGEVSQMRAEYEELEQKLRRAVKEQDAIGKLIYLYQVNAEINEA